MSPITNPSAPAALASGSATLGAGGTVNVAAPNVTANTVVRLNRQTVNGGAGELYSTNTAGTGFAINSSNTNDRGKVYWEIVSY